MGDKSKESGLDIHNRNGKMKQGSHIWEGMTAAQLLEFNRIRKLVEDLPELRIDRINKLATAIEDGTYHVSSQRIAEAIILKHSIQRPL